MTRCTERSFSTPLLGCVLAVTLAACSARGPRRPAIGPASAAPAAATAPTAGATPSADKGDPDARFQEALALMKARRYPEAQAAFLALTTDFPDLSGKSVVSARNAACASG